MNSCSFAQIISTFARAVEKYALVRGESMSKLEKWWLLAVVITSLIYILCACESNPKDDIITSKNDGSFNIQKKICCMQMII